MVPSLGASVELMVYHIQTKLQTEISESLKHDLESILYKYGQAVAANEIAEKEQWKQEALAEYKHF